MPEAPRQVKTASLWSKVNPVWDGNSGKRSISGPFYHIPTYIGITFLRSSLTGRGGMGIIGACLQTPSNRGRYDI